MLEDKKIKSIQNREFINEYLIKKGISHLIVKNPRYQSILWKLSNLLDKSNKRPFTDDAITFLDLITKIEEETIYFMESPKYGSIISNKYYIDNEDNKLKRLRIEKGPYENISTISTYNEDGIEICLETKQILGYETYFSKTTRVPNRIDMIKIERLKKIKEQLIKLEDVYQVRVRQFALEDINPDAEEIDPFDIMYFSISRVPEIYEDMSLKDQLIIEENQGKALPPLEQYRQKHLQVYKELNEQFGRTTSFEKGIAKLLLIKDKNLKKE